MGAFTDMLAEAKALGAERLAFSVDLTRTDGAQRRWIASSPRGFRVAFGRTGEEALRNLVEILRKEREAANKPIEAQLNQPPLSPEAS